MSKGFAGRSEAGKTLVAIVTCADITEEYE
jgi:hypothetical protein